MPQPQAHYYLLKGDSLHALNRLIEADRVISKARTDAMMESFKQHMDNPQSPPVTKPAVDASKLATDFDAAQVGDYRAKLGFTDPPVQVRDYADGTLFRAYHVLPKIAMNPGTSKMYFGLADLVNDPAQQPAERTAIYICYEDYKGNHFAPPDAQKLTEDEFAAYDDESDSFEYYRTYDEGVPMPADFDAAKHLTTIHMPGEHFTLGRASHCFILDDDVQKTVAAYDAAHDKWIMKYQDYRRDVLEAEVIPLVFGAAHLPVMALIDDATAPEGERAILFMLSNQYYAEKKTRIEQMFEITGTKDAKLRGIEVVAKPRAGTAWGDHMIDLLNQAPLEPTKPNPYGFTPRYTLDNHVVFDDKILGFPFMQIERPQDADVRLLAFRMPAHVKEINAPNADCVKISADDYIALSGAEDYFDKNNVPEHVFRLQGDTLKTLQKYEAEAAHYLAQGADFKKRVSDILGCSFSKYHLDTYRAYPERHIELRMPEELYAQTKPTIDAHFKELHSHVNGADGEVRQMTLTVRTDTDAGKALNDILAQVPYEPSFPDEIYRSLGFNANKGYDLLSVESLQGMKQKAILHHFPPYITKVDAPPNTLALTREELMQIVADSFDISGGSVLPPRPDHLKNLPTPEGYGASTRAVALKASKDADALPLQPRSDFSWFKIRRRN